MGFKLMVNGDMMCNAVFCTKYGRTYSVGESQSKWLDQLGMLYGAIDQS